MEFKNCLIVTVKSERVKEYSDYIDEFKNTCIFITKEDLTPLMKIKGYKEVTVRIEEN